MVRLYKQTQGFTLVELSIVIIIIGFLITGIAAGQSLIKQAQLNAVINEFSEYNSAIRTFQIKYGYLPGDFPDAFAFWGTSCTATASACNGNGNGFTDEVEYDSRKEIFMAWKHLNLSDILAGNYTGFSTLTNSAATIGLNLPASRFPNGGWELNYTSDYYTSNVDSVLIRRQALIIGAQNPISEVEYALFTPTDSASIDNKIDDGMPYTGRVVSLSGQAYFGPSWNCVNGSGVTATYNFSQTAPQCFMWFTYSDD